MDVAATVDVAADGHGGRFHSGHFHDSGRHGASSFVVPRPARASGSPRRALDRKRREKSNPALAAAAAAAAAVSTTAVSRDAATVDAEAEKIAAEAAAEERATLEVMDGYVTSLAGARRGSRGDADGSGSRSLVAGGLTPEAVAAIRAAEAAAAAAAANATAQPRGLFAGRGGFGAGFGGVGFGGVGNGPDADGDANGNGGDAKSTSARNRREGSLNPLEGVLSPLARGSYGDVSTPTPVKPPARFHPGDGDGDDFGSDAADAWSSAFGPRTPKFIPPGISLVSLAAVKDGIGGPPGSGPGSRRRSIDRGATMPTSGATRGPSSAAAPESVTDALSAAMAKGLDLVSGKSASAASASDSSTVRQSDGSLVRGSGLGGYGSGAPGDQWSPRGVLVAHLQEHRRPVRALVSSPDGLFFVSGGDDGACKLFDLCRLERDVSFRSRLTYASQGGRVVALAALSDDDHAVASASDNGTVHVWRPEFVSRRESSADVGGRTPPAVERYTGVAEIRQAAPGEGAVTALARLAPKVLCYATRRGFRVWDLRAPRDAFRVDVPSRLGAVTCAAAEPSAGSGSLSFAPGPGAGGDSRWLVFGTAAGALGVADVRFGIVSAEWRHPGKSAAPVEALALAPAPGFGFDRDAAPAAWVAAGADEIALFDLAEGVCRRVAKINRVRSGTNITGTNTRDDRRDDGDEVTSSSFTSSSAMGLGGRLAPAPTRAETREWSDVSAAPARDGVERDYRVEELRDAPPRTDGARCLLPLPSGAVLTGGSDACVRLWCPGDAARSRVVAGPLAPGARPSYEETAATGADGAPVPILCEVPPRPARGQGQGQGRGRGAADDSVAESVAAAAARHDCHRDAVLAMATAGFGSSRVLITGGRDTAVKVWK